MANFYISDLHIGHENILRFDNRPFANVNEMNNKLIENWNARVRSDDTVYILGDFIWAKESEWPSIVGSLAGNKVLIRGNHDPRQFSRTVRNMFQDITNLKEIKDDGKHVVMCHYPIPFFRAGFAPTAFMLYGHVHQTIEYEYIAKLRREVKANATGYGTPNGNFINVGCMMPYIIQNLAQLKALFEKQWESIVGNCDEFLYLGGNEQSTHEYVSKLLGKETIDTNTYGRSRGRNGSYSTNYQLAGRELMTPDEVRMLDNRYALLFIRGERPIRDLKYDILHHPNVALTTDGSAPAYTHGEDTRSIASMAFSFDKKAVKNAEKLEAEKHEFLLYSEEELEELLDEKEKKDNEEA